MMLFSSNIRLNWRGKFWRTFIASEEQKSLSRWNYGYTYIGRIGWNWAKATDENQHGLRKYKGDDLELPNLSRNHGLASFISTASPSYSPIYSSSGQESLASWGAGTPCHALVGGERPLRRVTSCCLFPHLDGKSMVVTEVQNLWKMAGLKVGPDIATRRLWRMSSRKRLGI